MTSVAAEVLDRPAAWRDGKRYLWPLALAVPLLPMICYGVVAKSGHEGWWWLGAVLVFVQVPLMDRMIGSDAGNPPEELVRALQSDRFYRWMTFLYLPLLFAGLAIGCWQWVTSDLGWVGRAGMIVTVGIVSGIAINTAHELGHKIEKLERRLSKLALAPSARAAAPPARAPPPRPTRDLLVIS